MTRIHLIGIGGAGLSAIATVLLQQGYTVSGSDMQPSAMTERLARLGAAVFIGHRAENLAAGQAAPGEPLEAVVVSSAIRADNPELVEARRQGLPVFKRADWLGRMMQNRLGIAIAGTHGKTTTTAMTAFVLREAGLDPTFIVGGFVPQMQTNAAAGQGDSFVIEADEYDHTFLGLRPEIAVVTFVEWDHPDIFPTPQSFEQAFVDFVGLVPPHGLVIACGDNPGARAVVERPAAPRLTYGLLSGNDCQAVDVQPNERGGFDFNVVMNDPAKAKYVSPTSNLQPLTSNLQPPTSNLQPPTSISLSVPGLHNVTNALAVFLIALRCGVDPDQAAASLGRFTGVGRRFELKGEVKGITIVDDYAHHPTEIKTTLAAARARFGARPLWAVFQPHTFSRTLALLDDFAAAFAEADAVIITDIFASRESDPGQVTSQDIVSRMVHPHARYIGSLAETTDYLAAHLAPPAVLLTLGAGDGYRVGEELLQRLNEGRIS